jgi:alpha-L-rhamnosidase
LHSIKPQSIASRKIRRHSRISLFSDVELEWCEGKIPTADGPINVRWWAEGDKIHCQADVPAGYVLKVENLTSRQFTKAGTF